MTQKKNLLGAILLITAITGKTIVGAESQEFPVKVVNKTKELTTFYFLTSGNYYPPHQQVSANSSIMIKTKPFEALGFTRPAQYSPSIGFVEISAQQLSALKKGEAQIVIDKKFQGDKFIKIEQSQSIDEEPVQTSQESKKGKRKW